MTYFPYVELDPVNRLDNLRADLRVYLSRLVRARAAGEPFAIRRAIAVCARRCQIEIDSISRPA